MSDKASKTIRIKWLRSGIGFPYRQKDVVRSLGLRRLNQVVERPDTPQIRGLVAKVPHLVAIVEESPKPAWASVPEYTVRPPERPPVEVKAPAAPESAVSEPVSSEVEPVPVVAHAKPAEEKREQAPQPAAPVETKKAKKPARETEEAKKKAKPAAKAAEKKGKKAEKEAAAKRGSKPAKGSKK